MRGRPPSIRDEEILDAARDVFREEGHATTAAKIAERAGVSVGILFYRFKTKEALLAAVIRREIQPPGSLLDLPKIVGKRSVAENLVTIVGAVLEAIFRAHPFLELALTSRKSGEIHQLLFVKDRKPPPQRIMELLSEYFEAEMHLDRVRAIDTSAAARAIFGACVEYVRSKQAAPGDKHRRAFVRSLVDILANGAVKSAPSRRRR